MKEYLLLTCDWQFVINSIPYFCWGVLIIVSLLVALYLRLKYRVNPIIQYKNEENSKKNSFDREKYWVEKKIEKEIIDTFKPFTGKGLHEEIVSLKSLLEQKEKDLSNKEKVNEKLGTRISIFERILKQLNVNVGDNG